MSSDPIWIGVGGLAIAIATSYATSLIQSVKAGRLIERLERAVKDIEDMRDDVGRIPVIEERQKHGDSRLEGFQHAVSSVTSKVETIWLKVFSHDKHIAVTQEQVRQQSHHSFDDIVSDTIPAPPKRRR